MYSITVSSVNPDLSISYYTINLPVFQSQSRNKLWKEHLRIFAFGEDSHALRLASELADLRAANANRRICYRRKCPAERWTPQPTEKPPRRVAFLLCLQVNSDADFVLSNLDAARWYTSPLVTQGLASDRDLPGLQNHACKRAYVSFFSINPLSRNRSIALYVLTFDTFSLFATSVCFTTSICSASSFAAIKYLNSDELI